MEPCTFQPKFEKQQKSTPKKNSLYFRKCNFLALILKKSLYFLKRSFSFLPGNGTLHLSAQVRKLKKFLLLQEMDFLGSNIAKFKETETLKKIPYISENRSPKQASYISGNRTFQSTPREFLILQETETSKKFFIFQEIAC